MNAVLVLIALLAGGGWLAHRRLPLRVATAAYGIGLLVLGRFAAGALADLVMLAGWAAFVVLVVFNFPDLRRRHVAAPVLAEFRNRLPPVSATEQAALDAGTVWWDAELFSGNPDWSKLGNLPAARLAPEEQAFLDGPVETLCGMVDEWHIAHELGDLPPEVWAFIAREGFLGMIIPHEFGGLGFSARAHSAVVQKIASRSGTAAVSVMVPNSLGPAELLLRYGTPEQQQQHLPRLARGEALPCFALTNPLAGSDAAAIPDRGVVCRGTYAGEEVLGIRLDWEKRYITLGPVATLLGLAFQLQDPDGLLGGPRDVGITLALLPTDHPGVEIGRRHLPAGQAFQNGPTQGHGVFIPIDWVIGGRARCGDGWRMLMNCLAAGRGISLPASSTAALKVCARTSGAYARLRRQFGLSIGRFEGVQEALARIARETYAVDAARELTLAALDSQEEPAVLSALLKYQATERMRRAVDDAMDVHGGRGVCDGPSNYLLAAYTAVPVAITVEGANILTRSLIVFGQGLVRCHPQLRAEIAAAADPDHARGLAAFDTAFTAHLANLLANLARTAARNLALGRAPRGPRPDPAYWRSQVDRASATFALLADCTLFLLGGALKRRESLSGRFADVLGELYLISAAVTRFEADGRPAADAPLLELVCRDGCAEVERRFDEILENLPSRALALALRAFVFPLGRRWRPASDALRGEVATALVESGEFRARLCRGTYVSADPEDVIGRLEHAVALLAASAPAERKIAAAIRAGALEAGSPELYAAARAAGIVDEAEEGALVRSAAAVRRAIDVDDFEPGELWPAQRARPPVADAA
jgi:acyl-CoA dehydrogenase